MLFRSDNITDKLDDIITNFHTSIAELENLTPEEIEEFEEDRLPEREKKALGTIIKLFTLELRVTIPYLLNMTNEIIGKLRNSLKMPTDTFEKINQELYSTVLFSDGSKEPIRISLAVSRKLINKLEEISKECKEYNKVSLEFVDHFSELL